MRNLMYAILAIIIFISCNEDKLRPQMSGDSFEGEIPSHESWDSKIIFSDDGKIKAVLFSDHLKKYENQKVTLLEGVKIDFYNNQQIKASQLTSKRGKVNDATRDMYAMEDVVAENDSGTVLKTSELMWRNIDQKIVTDKFVSIKSSKEIIEGYGMESDQNLRNYVIFDITYSAAVSSKK